MKYTFRKTEGIIVAIDENGAQNRVGDVLNFDDDSVIFFFVENEGTLEVAGYYRLSSGTIRFIDRYATYYEQLTGEGVDSEGRVVCTGNIDYRKIAKVHEENGWSLVTIQNKALLFNEKGTCIMCYKYKGVTLSVSQIKNGVLDLEGADKHLDFIYGESKESIRPRYCVDFKRHLFYELEPIPCCDTSFKNNYFRCNEYYKCEVTNGELSIHNNIVFIYNGHIGKITMLYDKPIDTIVDVYYAYDRLLALVKLEGANTYTYTYCHLDEANKELVINYKTFDGGCQLKLLQKTYCNLTIKTPVLQVIDPKTSERELYLYDKLIAHSASDFLMVGIGNPDFEECVRPTIVATNIHPHSHYFCSGDKIYNTDGQVIKELSNRIDRTRLKFELLDTWGKYIAGRYEGTNNYEFYALEFHDNKIDIEQALCHIHKVEDKVLISLLPNRANYVMNSGSAYGFDVTQDKFVIMPDFKPALPKRDSYDRCFGASTLNDAFEGEVDLYNGWLMN